MLRTRILKIAKTDCTAMALPAEEKPTIAFVLSLIGGIFILLGGVMMSMSMVLSVK